jgi:hypothetical protein
MESQGPNAYFLRDDLAPHIPAQRPADVWHMPARKVERRLGRRGKVADPVGELYRHLEDEDLPLVDLDGRES